MSQAETEWEEWAAEWRELAPPIDAPERLREQVQREHGRIRRVRVGEAALALATVAGIALAVAHAPTAEDVAHGAVIAGLVLAVAGLRLRGDASPDAQPTTSFLELSLRACRWRLRGVRCAWLVMALALAFLVPWWIDGLRVHGDVSGPLALVSAWLPAALLAGVFAWTLRLHARLRREIAALRERQIELDLGGIGAHSPR